MKCSIMILVVKHEGTNNPVDLMTEASKYHLEKTTSEKREEVNMTMEPREKVLKEFMNGFSPWLANPEQKLYYFGISKEELEKILK